MSSPIVHVNRAVAAVAAVARDGVEPKLRIAQDSADAPTENQLNAQSEIRDALNLVSLLAKEHIKDGRYLSIVETKLEEALLFAGKGVFA